MAGMGKERCKLVMSFISMASDEPDVDDFVKIVTQYGGRFDVTESEVKEVLEMKVKDVFR